jgi:hypothetical protein
MKKLFCKNRVVAGLALACLMICTLLAVVPERVCAENAPNKLFPNYYADMQVCSYTYTDWRDYHCDYTQFIRNIDCESNFYFFVYKQSEDDSWLRWIAFSSSTFSFDIANSFFYDQSSDIYDSSQTWTSHVKSEYDIYYQSGAYGSFTLDSFNCQVPYSESFDLDSTDSDNGFLLLQKIINGEDYGLGFTFGGFNSDSAEYSEDLGSLKDIQYKMLYLRDNVLDSSDVYYKFDFNSHTTSGIDLTQDCYDVVYYWECYADGVSLFGKDISVDSLFSDKFLTKEKQDSVYSLKEFAYEGDLYNIFESVIDNKPAVCRSFNVVTKLHVAPIYYDGTNSYIGNWSHITFPNIANSETLPELVEDEFDGNGLENDYEITTDNPDGSSSTINGTSTIGVGSTIDEAEHNSNLGTSTDVSVGSDDLWSNAQSMLEGIGNIPVIIAGIFSFLPSWCLGFIAVGFGLVVVLIVYKLVRG